MNQKKNKSPIPYYCTLPMLEPEHKLQKGNVTIPPIENVKQTRDWSKELKL
jgi:hypothetical protein